jgi:peptide/histidine transporter 3/4
MHVFFVALYLIALDTSGIKPCVSSFGAYQLDDVDEVEREHKSPLINWFYFSINIGALMADSLLVHYVSREFTCSRKFNV